MAKNPEAVPFTEKNNADQGKGADAKDKIKMGPAAGGGGSNPTKSGGIHRPAKGLGV
jgi:hypothetical protein